MNRQKGSILLVVLVALVAVTGIGFIVWKNPQLMVKQKPIITPPPPFSPPPASESGSTAGWKTYTTRNYYNISSKILEQLPSLSRGNFQFNYPSGWTVQDDTGASIIRPKLNVASTGITLLKPNLSQDKSVPDEPTKNMAIIDFFLKEIQPSSLPLNITLYEILSSFYENFGIGKSPSFNYLLKENVIDNLPAQYQYRTIEEVNSPQGSFPERILVGLSPTTILYIEIDFFNYGKDKVYSENTIKEINQILSTFRFLN